MSLFSIGTRSLSRCIGQKKIRTQWAVEGFLNDDGQPYIEWQRLVHGTKEGRFCTLANTEAGRVSGEPSTEDLRRDPLIRLVPRRQYFSGIQR